MLETMILQNSLKQTKWTDILTNHWIPDKGFTFAYSERNNGRREYASLEKLQKFDCLVYSNTQAGYFCKYCATMNMGRKETKINGKTIALG